MGAGGDIPEGHALVCGIDEAGRGPWAGPVVAGAVILDKSRLSTMLVAELDDSKKLKPGKREALFERLGAEAHIGVGLAEVAEEVGDWEKARTAYGMFLASDDPERAIEILNEYLGQNINHTPLDGDLLEGLLFIGLLDEKILVLLVSAPAVPGVHANLLAVLILPVVRLVTIHLPCRIEKFIAVGILFSLVGIRVSAARRHI